MRCEVCQGLGVIQAAPHDPAMPCASCNGSGSQNCCEGLVEQPESGVVIRPGYKEIPVPAELGRVTRLAVEGGRVVAKTESGVDFVHQEEPEGEESNRASPGPPIQQ